MKTSWFVMTLVALLGLSFGSGADGFAAGVPSALAESDNSKDKDSSEKGEKASDGKVLVCHVPQHNPSNRHTLSIDESAVDAHISHGDAMGACPAETLAPSNLREISGH